MASTVFLLMVMIWVIVITMLRRFSRGAKGSGKAGTSAAVNRQARRKASGLNGAKAPLFRNKNKDISCARFDHVHSELDNSSTIYVSPGEPEEGYIVLNGKKMRRTEADAYENSI